MRWFVMVLILWSCSRETEREKEILIPAQPFPRQECPACQACPIPTPGQSTPTPYPGENKIVAAINAARRLRGLAAVSEDSKLDCAAEKHAIDIGSGKICGHVGRDGSQFWQRAQRCGTQALGEIVACGHRDEKSAVQGWDQSPGHAAIMYSADYGKVGVYEFEKYYVAVFAE
jgi:uncharacterized protein YkwD